MDATLYGQDTEMTILEALLPYVEKTFIDIGAERGSFGKHLMSKGFRGVLCEPLRRHTETLAKLVDGTDSKLLPYAIDEADREADFHIALDDTGNEQDYFHSLQELGNDSHVASTRIERVTCRRLDSLAQEGYFSSHVGVLKTDTEGNDLRVLKSLGPVRADITICEFFTEGLYNGWSEAEPNGLIKYAASLGYSHVIAVRRRANVPGELVTYTPFEFGVAEWGNLFFITDPIFQAARASLAKVMGAADDALFSKLKSLQHECDARLEVIEKLDSALKSMRAETVI